MFNTKKDIKTIRLPPLYKEQGMCVGLCSKYQITISEQT